MGVYYLHLWGLLFQGVLETFVSSKGLNVLLDWEVGGGEETEGADSCTSGLLCDWYSSGKW